MYKGFLRALAEELEANPDSVLSQAVPLAAKAVQLDTQADEAINGIFIIHGHDEVNLLRFKEVLRDKWKPQPIVLMGKPGKGRTLIEKFEQEAQRAVFAFAILTPDDWVSLDEVEYAQARPNVVFELGWFFGRLRREKVCILLQRGTRIHSDLDGNPE
jgi:predicted nucleotide-binding protein